MDSTLIVLGISGLLFVLSVVVWDIRREKGRKVSTRRERWEKRHRAYFDRVADHISDDEDQWCSRTDDEGRFL